MISKSLLGSFLILGFFSQASLATNIEEIEEVSPPHQRTLNLGNIPYAIVQDVWRKNINPHLSLNKGLGYDDNDSILTVNKTFYYWVTGYWPEEKGVDRLPNAVIIPPNSWKISHSRGLCQEYTPENIPPFLWRSLLNTAEDLPDTFWPYLSKNNVHTVNFFRNKLSDEDALAFGESLLETNIHTVTVGFFDRMKKTGVQGVCDFAQYLSGTNVRTVNLVNESDEYALALSQYLPGTKVQIVRFSSRNIGSETQKFLLETYPHITWRVSRIYS